MNWKWFVMAILAGIVGGIAYDYCKWNGFDVREILNGHN